jgi:hypothetical protein
MAVKWIDALGHEVPDLNGPSLAAGTTGTTTLGTIAPLAAGAGVGSAVSGVVANDRRGSFGLTAAGTPAAGVCANVIFANPYAAAPAAVLVNIYDVTDTTAPVACDAAAVTAAGFSIVSAVLTASKAYLVNYVVLV